MKYLASFALSLAVAQATLTERSSPLGIDVSNVQSNINWDTVVHNNIKFVYILATEGSCWISCTFDSQYIGATDVNLIRGGYHLALPDVSSGADQAHHFYKHGGGWSADGITLPGALAMDSNPMGPKCYNLTPSGMVSWIKDFSNTYHSLTGRYPVIYTTTEWWKACTGNSADFAANNPLWIAYWSSTVGTLPAGWMYTSFWQYAGSGPNPGNADLWNGDYAGLQRMARGH